MEEEMKWQKPTNEITGAYYEEKTDWLTILFGTLAVTVVTLVLLDFIFGAETMTEVYAEGVMFIRSVI